VQSPALSPSLPLVVLVAALGLAVGSFLNVVIHRVPRGESLVAPGSHCPVCDTPIKARHNVPVLSWVALRGRCAACAAPISLRYPLVEAATAALFVGIALRVGLAPQLPAYLYLASVAVALTMIVVDVGTLPDSIVIPSYVVTGLLLIPAVAAAGNWWTGERATLGMLALLTLSFALAIALPTAVSFGDVKVAGLLGLYLGWASWSALALGVLVALVLAVSSSHVAGFRLRMRSDMVPFSVNGAALMTPIAPALLAAGILAIVITSPATGWYAVLPTG
jgi:leader peptidase (prepilin peptidase)/N-methyltransferase